MAQGQERQGKMIRRVTRVDVVRGKQGDGQPGAYQFDLTLDGVEEYLLVPGGDEMSTLLRLFQRSESVLLDQRTDELTFENYHGS